MKKVLIVLFIIVTIGATVVFGKMWVSAHDKAYLIKGSAPGCRGIQLPNGQDTGYSNCDF